MSPAFPHHIEAHGEVAGPVTEVFAFLDDHSRLSAHMTRRSWMMAGSRMAIETDPKGGRAVGSRISLYGRVLGVPLRVDEVVVEREPPYTKVWQTVGAPQLLVIGPYRMGFRLEPRALGSLLTVFVDWAPPASGFGRAAAALFGPGYARWCTQRMVHDARAHFAPEGA